MKRLPLISALALLLMAGCATKTRSTPGGPTIEVFRDGQTPSRPFKQLAVIKAEGTDVDASVIENKLIQQAQSLGGNAILFDPKKEIGVQPQTVSFGVLQKIYLYQGRVVIVQ
ncbi:MAG TPA: hypothetical protein PLX89_15185 [Verrucomicrobiota bacterium]|nr:hypothetical protein [Verrucomicrobiales bacterium]HRI14336.1 hypothetical protein [Verrucomicrobiota bacterium]